MEADGGNVRRRQLVVHGFHSAAAPVLLPPPPADVKRLDVKPAANELRLIIRLRDKQHSNTRRRLLLTHSASSSRTGMAAVASLLSSIIVAADMHCYRVSQQYILILLHSVQLHIQCPSL